MNRFMVVVAVMLLAGTAGAEALAPTVEHQPLKSVAAGRAVEFRVRILSNSAKPIFNPTLYFRVPTVGPSYSRIDLKPIAGVSDLYAATIPADLVSGDFDYYLEAYDEAGNGPSRVGSDAQPVHVAVAGGAVALPQTNPNAYPPLNAHPTANPTANPRPTNNYPPLRPPDAKPTPPLAVGGITPAAPAPAVAPRSHTAAYVLLGVGIGAMVVGAVMVVGGGAAYPENTQYDDNGDEIVPTSAYVITGGLGLGLLGVVSTAVGGGLLLFESDSPKSAEVVNRNPGVASVVLDFQPPRFNGLSLGR